MKNFALIGTAGYVAPRHLQAIRDTGNVLVASLDRSDSVGILDGFFPDAGSFTEYERFDRYCEKLKRRGEAQRVHYVSIASPNYLHDAHIRFALRIGADAVCEKPVVLNPWNIEALQELERETGRRVHCILQLRLHPAIVELKKRMAAVPPGRKAEVELTYVTTRGVWYFYSWKGDAAKSGGIATNIGIHFFDMLQWIFGPPKSGVVHRLDKDRAAGAMELERANVRWYLSLAEEDLPGDVRSAGRRTHRRLLLDGEEFVFSEGFGDLHTASYRNILAGEGFGLADAGPSIDICYRIRTASPVGNRSNAHPLAFQR